MQADEELLLFDYQGTNQGRLHVRVTPTYIEQEPIPLPDDPANLAITPRITEVTDELATVQRRNQIRILSERSIDNYVGKELRFQIEILKGCELPTANVYAVKYNLGFPNKETLTEATSSYHSDTVSPTFGPCFQYRYIISKKLCKWLTEDAIEFQLWGSREKIGKNIDIIQSKTVLNADKTIADQLDEVHKELRLLSKNNRSSLCTLV
mmetsp:Transcript_4312/g.5428  ORF Transcript_4312/g.5428 Transcript_4312/m.5428 type:complete len:209 (+) Transcript_4312:377-1003(+)